MPWKALPFEHREVKDALSRRFGVRGIPTMILLKREPVSEGGGWAVEHADLRSLIVSEPERFPWPPVPLPTIDAAVASINETPTVVVFTDKMTDAAAEAALVAAARAAASLPRFFPDGAPHPRLRFAHAGEAHDATEQVRHFAGFGKDRDGPAAARVVLIDVEAQGKAELPPAPGGELPTADALAAFADAALAGAVQLVPFGKGAA